MPSIHYSKYKLRLVAGIVSLCVGLLCPWYIFTLCALFFLYYFSYFFEAVLVALLIDATYGTPLTAFFHSDAATTTMVAGFLVIMEMVKDNLRSQVPRLRA